MAKMSSVCESCEAACDLFLPTNGYAVIAFQSCNIYMTTIGLIQRGVCSAGKVKFVSVP